MTRISQILTCACLTTLTACGGGGGNSGPDLSTTSGFRTATLNFIDEREATVRDGPTDTTGFFFTKAANIPTEGSVEFTGTGGGSLIDPASPAKDYAFIGDASVTVNFKDNDITGAISNIFVGDTTGSILTPNKVSAATGQLTLSNGDIGTDTASAIAVDIDGDLTFDGKTASLDGRLTGNLLGNVDAPVAGENASKAIYLAGETQEIVDPETGIFHIGSVDILATPK